MEEVHGSWTNLVPKWKTWERVCIIADCPVSIACSERARKALSPVDTRYGFCGRVFGSNCTVTKRLGADISVSENNKQQSKTLAFYHLGRYHAHM